MKRIAMYTAILIAAAAAYGHAGTVTSLQGTLLSTSSEPMPMLLIGGFLMGLGLIGRRPHSQQ